MMSTAEKVTEIRLPINRNFYFFIYDGLIFLKNRQLVLSYGAYDTRNRGFAVQSSINDVDY